MRNRNIGVLLMLWLGLSAACIQAQNKVIVKGTFAEYKAGQQVKAEQLDYDKFNHKKLGQFAVKPNGSFEATFTFTEPALCSFTYGKRKMLVVADKPGTIVTVLDKDKKQTVEGSQATADLLRYEAKKKALIGTYAYGAAKNYEVFKHKIRTEKKGIKDRKKLKEIDHKHAARKQQLKAKLAAQEKKVRTELYQFIYNQMPTSPMLYATLKYWMAEDLEHIKPIVKAFKDAHPNWKLTHLFENKIQRIENIMIGKVAPELNLQTPEGTQVKIASLRGKYVLLEFWASWCGPCRRQNPGLVKLYNQYQPKGFSIYGVSFDHKRAKWLKAIKKDKLTWTQVSDLKGGGASDAYYLYNIKYMPANLLLDKEGKIIAKDLKGDELRKKLEELLDQ